MTEKITTFTDLNAWKYSYRLGLAVYSHTDGFPSKEQFGLTSQMRRAVISISSNIAEGFSRQSKADKAHFYTMAQGSLTELQSQMLIARGIGYLAKEDLEKCYSESTATHKLLTGLINSVKGSGK